MRTFLFYYLLTELLLALATMTTLNCAQWNSVYDFIVPIYGSKVLEQTMLKFGDLLQRYPPVDCEHDHEYVDYALHSLRDRVSPFELLYGTVNLSRSPLAEVKVNVIAEKMREIGNTAFLEGNFKVAHYLYSACVIRAVPGSVELALAYGNRSAALFSMQLYKECVEDIKRAFEIGYPEDKKQKLVIRQRKAKRLAFGQKPIHFHGQKPVIKNANPTLPAASSSLAIKEDAEFGRHIVATKDIRPGEVVLVEKPYVQWGDNWCPLRLVLCTECCELCFNTIPCDMCSAVVYCSETCRKKAYLDYHRYECAVLRHFGVDMIDFVGTRMTLKGLRTSDPDSGDNRYKECTDLSYDSKMDKKALIGIKAVSAAKVFHVLKYQTDFFMEFDVENKDNVVKAALLKNTLISTNNSCMITFNDAGERVGMGRGLYPTYALFNHSCEENLLPFFYGSVMVVKAKKLIKAGEQCYVNYGEPAHYQTRKRKRALAVYNFECKCRPCIEKWPKVELLDNSVVRLTTLLSAISEEANKNLSIDKKKREVLLHQTMGILQKLGDKAPCMTYKLSRVILLRLLADGNKGDNILAHYNKGGRFFL